MLSRVFLILIWICFWSHTFSQNKIHLLPGSEIAEYDQSTGIHKLYRNVKFESQDNTIYCDSAIFNENTNHIRSFGNVHIQKESINIFCDSFDYQTKREYAKLWGNVRGRDLEYKISSDSMEYDLKTGMALFKNKGRIESIVSDERISSQKGYFYPKTKDFFFSGDVRYAKKTFYITTDTLQYQYAKQTAIFFGPTQITNDSVEITCNSGYYDIREDVGKIWNKACIKKKEIYAQSDTLEYNSKDNSIRCLGNAFYKDDSLFMKVKASSIFHSDSSAVSLAKGRAIIEKVMDKDTLVFIADSLVLIKDSVNSLDKIQGFYHVEIHHKNFEAIGDSGFYSAKTKEFTLQDNPILWSKNIEFKARYFKLFLNDSTIDSLYMEDKSSIIAEIDSLKEYYNQLYGNKMNVKFKNSKITQSIIEGNALSIYFPEDKKMQDSTFQKTRYGVNKLVSSELNIYFKENEIYRVSYINQPEGKFTPFSKIKKSDCFGEQFKVSFQLRPTYQKPEEFQLIL